MDNKKIDWNNKLDIIFVCIKCHNDLHNGIGGK